MSVFLILALSLLAACSGTFIKVPGQCPDNIEVVNGFNSSDINGFFEVIASSSLGPQNIRQIKTFAKLSQYTNTSIMDCVFPNKCAVNVYTTPGKVNVTEGFKVRKTDQESVFDLIPKGNFDTKTLVPLKGYTLGSIELFGSKIYIGYACGNINEDFKQEELSMWVRSAVPYPELIMVYARVVYPDLYPVLESTFDHVQVVGN